MVARSEDWIPFISGSSAEGFGIFYRAALDARGYGLHYEIAINLESAGIQIGRPFGFDIQINEDDNGGDRDAKWAWFEKTGFDRSWLQPCLLYTSPSPRD